MNLDISLTEALLSTASVAAGAFAGGLVRGLLSKLRGRYTGTACSNMLACFALGIMLARVDLGALVHLPYWEIAFGTGFCGALSTLATAGWAQSGWDGCSAWRSDTIDLKIRILKCPRFCSV